VNAFIGLGANLGNARAALVSAVRALSGLPDTRFVKGSSLYASAPVDAGGPDYLNAVVQLDTALEPLALLHAMQAIENAAGRERPYPNAPRTLDLDILLYGTLELSGTNLTLPHPRMWQRAFVLLPLSEIAPERVRPEQLTAVARQRIERVAQAAEWIALPEQKQ
jgi:2-amino-4-hydroxy-6-hydroxymethyldihydropteridine diphosphokinase